MVGSQLKSMGRVNGIDGYSFMICASDKQPNDLFRIRIASSSGANMHDNGVKQPLTGGQIKIHGYLVKAADQESFKVKLDKLMKDDELRIRLGKKAAMIEDELAIEKIAEQWLALKERFSIH